MNFIKITLISLCALVFSCKGHTQKEPSDKNTSKTKVINKTPSEWKAQLTDMQYYVMREEGTERAFSSPLNKNYEKGTYICAACDTPLFESEHKFDSGTGWPSFDRPIEGNVAYSSDRKLGYTRTEEHCAVCGGHLGHIFNDGPSDTTGKRHCINGVALKFIPENEK